MGDVELGLSSVVGKREVFDFSSAVSGASCLIRFSKHIAFSPALIEFSCLVAMKSSCFSSFFPSVS